MLFPGNTEDSACFHFVNKKQPHARLHTAVGAKSGDALVSWSLFLLMLPSGSGVKDG